MVAKVLLGPSSFGKENDAPLRVLREAGCEVLPNPYGRKLTREELLVLLPGVQGLIAGLEPLDRPVLTALPDLKVISRCGSGMSNVDQETARELGIRVYSTPNGPTRAVAELTLGCLLTLIRDVGRMDRGLRAGRWEKRVGRQLAGMRVLMIGYGRIGQAVGELLMAFGAELMVSDPLYRGAETVSEADFKAALGRADVISLHCSGEKELLGREAIAAMKPGVFLLNAARGGLIDEEALVEALREGRIAGAWIDTFVKEPYQGALCSFEQVLLTPHVGSYTTEGRLQMETDTSLNLLAGLREAGLL
ncbi:MAG: phosphoglycerate dehydrogenase [Magnetococcales bacterium]|nr:phosphoglycerate dehydrogenase [Magnetococcales bacterium]